MALLLIGRGNAEENRRKAEQHGIQFPGASGQAHNDYVEAVAETGLVGAVLILSALALFFRLAFRDLGSRLRSGGDWIQVGAALGCCGLLVHSFFDYNLHIPANAAWFAVLAGMAMPVRKPVSLRRLMASETVRHRVTDALRRSAG